MDAAAALFPTSVGALADGHYTRLRYATHCAALRRDYSVNRTHVRSDEERVVEMRTGGSLLAQALSQAGIREIFTLHGGHLDALLVACVEYGLRLTDTRHEASAGHAADAYARVSGDIGVCVVTSGPGFTNVYSAIANAYLDRTPTLFIVGAPPLRETETNPLQGGFDQIASATPITKWAYRLTEPARIPEIVALAIRHATTGAPGPVLLEVPIDVMFGEADEATVRFPVRYRLDAAAAPGAGQVDAALDVLAEAERPMIIVGGGVTYAKADQALLSFAETVGVPVFHPNKSDGALPAGHPLYGGGLAGMNGLRAVGAQRPDVVLLIGARAGMFTGGRRSAFAGARLVQIDIDGAEMGRLYDVEVPIVADCRQALIALTEAAAQRHWPDWTAWTLAAVSAQHVHRRVFTDPGTTTGRVHPYFAAKAVMDACPPDAILVLDGGESAAWADYFATASTMGSVLRLGYLGCLGVGPGFAIGASRARPGSPVVQVTGDGAIGMHIQEFDTMVRHRIPVVTVVLNNAAWGMSIHGQQRIYDESVEVASRLADSDYEKVAEAFGGRGVRIADADAIPEEMKRALASDLPTCLNIAIDPEITHPVTTTMLGNLTNPDEIIVPYYENIPRTK